MERSEDFNDKAYELWTFMRGSFLEAYCGLRMVRTAENKDYLNCPYANMAINKFNDSSEEYEKFKQCIKDLSGIL